ncbi:MAG: helicase-related protein [Aulosira sp. ZfuVER01]|nr:DEAD/DEAH box helicase family protein [Aulosira sp. ZfuVER01]MDZ8002909.1 DEAD/DEAH box helicase family protein [Aulosira sp. DedVER01a]MDZ8053578.1 DEAD/DEAH box helicase family protein [Aulosira sp. ZfuCHP01]
MTDSPPRSWFDSKTIYEQIQYHFPKCQSKIRIASGYFTVNGWDQIRDVVKGKYVDLLVGINERTQRQDERHAQHLLIQEIKKDLATGSSPGNRRQAVADLVNRIRTGQFRIVDARARKHHAKLYFVDCKVVIITSANLTKHGLMQQVEAGNPLSRKKEIVKLVKKFDGYFAEAVDLTQRLLKALEDWLKLATPWDIYLKTLLAFEDVEIDNKYTPPTNYQRAMIAETLQKISDHSGVMLVASTGLGKTVVATHLALKLFRSNEIIHVLIIGPKLVKRQWQSEFMDAGIPQTYIGYQALDKEDPSHDRNLEHFIEIEEKINKQWLIIIDECHLFRNCHDSAEGPRRRSFQRLISRIKESGCKVLLLTGSPYSKDIRNLNHQILLLPHTAEIETFSDKQNKNNFNWHTDSIKGFINLPVVSQLTTPYVAQQYGKKLETGILIEFGQQKRYIPLVKLYRVNFHLFMESEISQVFRDGCFTVNDPPASRKFIETQAEVAWVSSPWALREIIKKVINTPGKRNLSYEFGFEMSQSQRREILEPLLSRLNQMQFTEDHKLASLCNFLQKAHFNSKKIIIFCERRATVVYLVEAINALLPNLRVFGTIKQAKGQYVHRSDREIFQAIKKFAPVANRAEGKYKETYEIFISTDAHGVGINLQDAPVVINYDLAWTAIEPTQRAGRVLRPWIEPRNVELYTFVPPLEGDALRDLGIAKRYSNLANRHSQSQEIMELPVLSINEKEEVNFFNNVSKVTIQSGVLDLEALVDDNISPYYHHASKLYNNRDYARKIRDDIISAKIYSGRTILIYVLFKHEDEYKWAVYEPKSKSLRNISRNQLLDWLECKEHTELALVNTDEIEELSYACIKEWSKQNNANLDDIVRECAMYLKPSHQTDDVESLARY